MENVSETSTSVTETNVGVPDAHSNSDTPHLGNPPPAGVETSSPNTKVVENRSVSIAESLKRSMSIGDSLERSGVLVQEVDEGQPCLMCRDKCPGYTSHVWRRLSSE
ncbi:uncharacterized protein [Palaemon carinicauda]|uniref:uncharacterized protein n=1 Tax=Palaemon carinicauda TaxID=392227 RepID=UPI0035B5ABF2